VYGLTNQKKHKNSVGTAKHYECHGSESLVSCSVAVDKDTQGVRGEPFHVDVSYDSSVSDSKPRVAVAKKMDLAKLNLIVLVVQMARSKDDDDIPALQKAVRSLEFDDEKKVGRLGTRSRVLLHGLTDRDIIVVLARGVSFTFSKPSSQLIVGLKVFPPAEKNE
jgi:hypothetical protein